MLKLMDGSYVNTAHVSRFFVTEDFTVANRFAIKVSMVGPQMPFTVATYTTSQGAYEALDQMVYKIDNEALAIGLQSMVCLPLNTTLIAGVGQSRSTSAHR